MDKKHNRGNSERVIVIDLKDNRLMARFSQTILKEIDSAIENHYTSKQGSKITGPHS